MRSVIQLGLSTWAEFIYLSHDDWVDRMEYYSPLLRIPDVFTQDRRPFRYYGVDINPVSIQRLADQFGQNTRTRWICAGISDGYYMRELPIFDSDGTETELSFKIGTMWCPFMPMRDLITALDLSSFDVLAIDVDGYEHVIFQDMGSWRLTPTYITLEAHDKSLFPEDRKDSIPDTFHEDLIQRIAQLGYNLINAEEKHNGNVTELQFLKHDV